MRAVVNNIIQMKNYYSKYDIFGANEVIFGLFFNLKSSDWLGAEPQSRDFGMEKAAGIPVLKSLIVSMLRYCWWPQCSVRSTPL